MRLSAKIFLISALSASAAPDATVTLVPTLTGAADSHFRFTGVNLDFWPSTKSGWGSAGALNLDLANPNLAALARGLNGSLLRLGGSPADYLLYETPSNPDACSAANLNKTQPTPHGYFCPIWDQAPGQCLTLARWRALLTFAADAGLSLVLDLNACWGRASPNAEMDWSLIDGLLVATAAARGSWGAALWGVEFGNELYSNIAAPLYGASMLRLRQRLDALWPAPARAPVALGPDAWENDLSPTYYRAMLNASRDASGRSAMHAVTFHDYAEDCCAPTEGNVLNVTCLDAFLTAANWVRDIAAEYGVRTFNGEGALHAYSGVAGLTNTALSTLYYLHALGTYADNGMGLFSRQSLIGGDYELVNRSTFLPTPDYFGLLLWRAIVSSRALAASIGGAGAAAAASLRAHAFCAQGGGLAFLLVNFAAAQPLSVALAWPQAPPAGAQAQLYLLTGVAGFGGADASSDLFRIALNGEVLGLENGALPALAPRAVAADAPVALPPASAAFVVLPGAQAAACAGA